MLAKRPIYNKKLQCVAFEILSEYKTEHIDAVKTSLIELLNCSDNHLPLFMPFELKSIIEDNTATYQGPIILKLAARDIDSTYPLKEIKKTTFSIALHISDVKELSWIDIADYIAVSEHEFDDHHLKQLISFCKEHKRKVIANSLDRPISFERCKALHLDYYCGDFMFVPDESNDEEIASAKLYLIQLIQLVQRPDCDFDNLVDIIKKDPLLTYQLLKIANSVIYAGYGKITSIPQALQKMGLINIKNWIMLLSMKNISEKPIELIESALIRAHMAQVLAEKKDINPNTAYTAGLLSILEGLLNKPMKDIVKKLYLAEALQEALVEKTGALGQILSLVIDYEEGHWDKLAAHEYLGVDLSKLYIESLGIANASTIDLH